MSLDLFPGKLMRGRVISSESGKLRIELGGAQLEAKSTRSLVKGDTVVLRVNNITKNGVSLEIVDTIPRSAQKTQPSANVNITNVQVKHSEADLIRQSVSKLFELSQSSARISEETNLTHLLRSVLEPGQKYDFLFIAYPLKLDDEKTRNIEILMRKISGDEEDHDKITRELFFALTTPGLGNISGKVLTVGKQMRIDMNTPSSSTAKQLETIINPLKDALLKSGFKVTSVNIRTSEFKYSIENHLENY